MILTVGMGRFWMYFRVRAARLGMDVKVGMRERWRSRMTLGFGLRNYMGADLFFILFYFYFFNIFIGV